MMSGSVQPNLSTWMQLAQLVDDLQGGKGTTEETNGATTSQDEVVIAVVGKYTGLSDSYLSVIKVLACVCRAKTHRH